MERALGAAFTGSLNLLVMNLMASHPRLASAFSMDGRNDLASFNLKTLLLHLL